MAVYELYKDGEFVNAIVANEDFVIAYCDAMGYTFERRADPIPIPEPEPMPEPPDPMKLLQGQVKAQSDRLEFIEDCIAEMATMVYE